MNNIIRKIISPIALLLSAFQICAATTPESPRAAQTATTASVQAAIPSDPAPASAGPQAATDLETDLLQAVEAYNAGNWPDAISRLQSIVTQNPDYDAAHYYLALSYARQNDLESAENEFLIASGLDPANFWYRYRLAMLYSVTGKEELTLALFEDMVRDFPKRYELYYSMVDLYVRSGQDEKALETLDQVETVFGKNEITVMSRYELLESMDRTDEAYRCLEEYNEEYSSPQIITLLADRKLATYEEETALKMYDEALSLAPGYAPALVGKSEAYRMMRKYDEFFGVLGEFVREETVPVQGKCRYLDAVISSFGQNFLRIFRPQLDSLMTDCEATHPSDTTVNFTTGKYYYATDRGELAKERFRANSVNHPESRSSAAAYVELLMYLEQWETLSAEGQSAFKRFPEEPVFNQMAGIGEYHLGNYEKVIDLYTEILATGPRDSTTVLESYQTIGDMYYRTGDEKKAFKAYDRALSINPDYTPVLNNYAYYLSLQGKKLKKACAMSKKTVDQHPDNSTYLDTYGWILFLMGKAQDAKPIFKNAVMLYGGKDNPEILDHYAEVLYALGEYQLAFLYWNQAKAKNQGDVIGLDEKIELRKSQMNSRK